MITLSTQYQNPTRPKSLAELWARAEKNPRIYAHWKNVMHAAQKERDFDTAMQAASKCIKLVDRYNQHRIKFMLLLDFKRFESAQYYLKTMKNRFPEESRQLLQLEKNLLQLEKNPRHLEDHQIIDFYDWGVHDDEKDYIAQDGSCPLYVPEGYTIS